MATSGGTGPGAAHRSARREGCRRGLRRVARVAQGTRAGTCDGAYGESRGSGDPTARGSVTDSRTLVLDVQYSAGWTRSQSLIANYCFQ